MDCRSRKQGGWLRPAMIAAGVVAALLAGCTGPDKANIKLRKDNQQLQGQIEQLRKEKAADEARIAGFEQQIGTLPTLPQDRLARMFTVHSVRLGPLTGGTNLDPAKGDEALKIYLEPLDESGDNLKVAGTITVEAFDLEKQGDQRIGRWEFPPQQAKQNWYSLYSFRYFIFTCPWQSVPTHRQITIKVTFRDELTGRVLNAQTVATVNLPPAPASAPTTRP